MNYNTALQVGNIIRWEIGFSLPYTPEQIRYYITNCQWKSQKLLYPLTHFKPNSSLVSDTYRPQIWQQQKSWNEELLKANIIHTPPTPQWSQNKTFHALHSLFVTIFKKRRKKQYLDKIRSSNSPPSHNLHHHTHKLLSSTPPQKK